jgi:hypothetical protein
MEVIIQIAVFTVLLPALLAYLPSPAGGDYLGALAP